jgi:hypothetical protein
MFVIEISPTGLEPSTPCLERRLTDYVTLVDLTGRELPELSMFLVDFDALAELLVLIADEFDRFLIYKALIDAHGERFGIRLWVFYHHVNFELSERGPSKAFGEMCLLTIRTAANIEPAIACTGFCSAKVIGFHNERIAFPASDRIAVPPR